MNMEERKSDKLSDFPAELKRVEETFIKSASQEVGSPGTELEFAL